MIMHVAYLVASLAWSHGVVARSGRSLVDRRFSVPSRFDDGLPHSASSNDQYLLRRQNANTSAFAVDGTKIPEVDWDVGESYAGLLPVSQESNETDKLYFWYFPSTSDDAEEELVIWRKSLASILRNRLVQSLR
jgi:carboxypeptidase D